MQLCGQPAGGLERVALDLALALQEAWSSTEGRFAWWQGVWENRLIPNMWLGNGFQVSMKDFQILAMTSRVYEWFTVTGGYHSGPLSSMHYVGIVGMGLFYTLLIYAAVVAVRTARRCRADPLFPLTAFLAIYFVWQPVHFTFVFGAYDSEIVQLLLNVGILRLVIRLLEQDPARIGDSSPADSGSAA